MPTGLMTPQITKHMANSRCACMLADAHVQFPLLPGLLSLRMNGETAA
jgi:hypothetical protein